MKVYHGSTEENLDILKFRKSRYGFPVIFFTPDISLAKNYVLHNRETGTGELYSFNYEGYPHEIDYSHAISHSRHFRNMIYQLRDEGHDVVLIKNVKDHPSQKYADYISKDILVFFDFNEIKGIEKIEM